MQRISAFFLLGVCLSVFANEVKLKEPAPEFSRHSIVKLPNFRVKRNVFKAPIAKKEISLPFILNEKNIVLDLKLNTDLMIKNPSNSKSYVKEEELCEYIGKVRGAESSRVAVSVCGDPATVQGTVFDGINTYYIEPATSGGKDTAYYVYNRKDLIKKRNKRSILPSVRLPFGRSIKSYYQTTSQVMPKNKAVLRILLVVGETVKKMKASGNSKSFYEYCRRLMNEVYSFYSDLGVTVKLAGVKQILYGVENKIIDNASAHRAPLFRFRDYIARNNISTEYKYDAAVFLSDELFAEVPTVGRAFAGSVCTNGQQNSVGVISTKGSWFMTSTTVAHEVGHILGLLHEEDESSAIAGCPHRNNKYIMSAFDEPDVGKWSECSMHVWEQIVKTGRADCLMGERPKPDSWKVFKY